MLVKDVMNVEVFYVGLESTLLEAAEQMMTHGVDTLLILENDQLHGILGLRDLFTVPIPAHYGGKMLHHEDEAHLLKIWQDTPVRNLMNEQVLTVREEMGVLRALELMVNTGKHPLPVLRDGKVVGVISRMDITRALVAEHKTSV
jgi:CBS domain-containing protein